ncbi:MAG TPA: hypothetical protein VEL79_06725, partial [Vicinamibacterales bacterium]|nr:hypothetical protein [Vicinamibacterales bacterium]
VAASTNRLTLIAAIIPPLVVTTHTIFCLREPLDDDAQWFLCGIFNSFVANYFVRLRAGTHVPASVIHRLPAPKPASDSILFARIAALARGAAADASARPALQSLAARAYGLSRDDLRYVLGTFPLVPIDERAAVVAAFERQETTFLSA